MTVSCTIVNNSLIVIRLRKFLIDTERRAVSQRTAAELLVF